MPIICLFRGISSTNSYSPRSSRPACMVKGCPHRVLVCDVAGRDGTVLWSIHCKEHACRQRLGNVMCLNAKYFGSTRYCHDHGLCHSPGCVGLRVNAATGQEWAYCQAHTCYADGCRQKRLDGTRTCNLHTPRCVHPSCSEPRSDSGFYCTGHSCADSGCSLPNFAGPWCHAHGSCSVVGCGKPREPAAAKNSPPPAEQLCAEHKKKICTANNCEKATEAGRKWCARHECGYPTCKEPQGPKPGGVYCRTHTCHRSACRLLVRDPQSPFPPAKYCAAHACALPSCALPADPGMLCALHMCAVETCGGQRAADPAEVPSAKFCTAHECVSDGCAALARGNGSTFCSATHACESLGCPKARGEGMFCDTHVARFSRALYEVRMPADWDTQYLNDGPGGGRGSRGSRADSGYRRPGAPVEAQRRRATPASTMASPPENSEVLEMLARRHEEERRRMEAAEDVVARGRKGAREGARRSGRRDDSFDSGLGDSRSVSSASTGGRTHVD